MSAHFYKIRVSDVRRETADCVSIAFDIPQDLQGVFRFIAGQFLTLRKQINGAEIRRCYSLCSAPHEGEWRIAVKKVEGGVFSTYLTDHLQPGDLIEVMPPNGNFTHQPNVTNDNHYTAIAGGSGITPVIAIIKSVLTAEPFSSITLVYGNRFRHSIIFREALEALKNRYIDRFRIIHILSQEITDAAINTGRINAEKCDSLFAGVLPVVADKYFICGPQEMISCVKDVLLNRSIPESHIHFELFSVEGAIPITRQRLSGQTAAAHKSRIGVQFEGNLFEFDLDPEGETILDAAVHNGLDLPYSCKSGVCTTCKAKLTEGKVTMDINYGLEPDEVQAGYILTCQSHPATDKVRISFDVK